MMTETKPVVFLPLSQGKVAVIDFDDFERVRGLKWCAQKMGRRFYAIRGQSKKIIKLHRVITNCPPERVVNHINGDGLDNRRENLQICTRQQNMFAHQRKRKDASSTYRGVCWHKQKKRWSAQITHNDKDVHIGYFDAEKSAARAYDAKARELFGPHASPNFS